MSSLRDGLFKVSLALGALWICLFPTLVFSQALFYQGKSITLIHGRDPGGSGDLRVRAVIPLLQKYIPGNPTFMDPEFHKEYRKVVGEDPTPLMPEDNEWAIRELPRDPEIVELFKRFAGAGPLPPR